MTIEPKDDGYWIVDVPEGVDEMGPYKTKAEAEEDLKGVKRFLKACDEGVEHELLISDGTIDA